jgi:hypothetical protein
MCDQASWEPTEPYETMIKAIRARIEANPAGVDRYVLGYKDACFDILEELAAIRSVDGHRDD